MLVIDEYKNRVRLLKVGDKEWTVINYSDAQMDNLARMINMSIR